MARPELRALLAAVALFTAACNQRTDLAGQGSVTVKLPEARRHTPAPAFTFKQRAADPTQARTVEAKD